jgi:hypothetical protein
MKFTTKLQEKLQQYMLQKYNIHLTPEKSDEYLDMLADYFLIARPQGVAMVGNRPPRRSRSIT